ncbi:unnamed protein product [Rangifer tarandus platyrhynchus]|uniref:Uncharacterized protein n=2 Tax=Rangifer tarandus platyrhynchus TaxID=3082113 RepID=A0ACB0E596_RANTA|nr:unnamed protein product [Rangifer tarandus platyrhynchus]CAI9695599.1 unnamed protein product [Rangifer tarandus platyrhynchus]
MQRGSRGGSWVRPLGGGAGCGKRPHPDKGRPRGVRGRALPPGGLEPGASRSRRQQAWFPLGPRSMPCRSGPQLPALRPEERPRDVSVDSPQRFLAQTRAVPSLQREPVRLLLPGLVDQKARLGNGMWPPACDPLSWPLWVGGTGRSGWPSPYISSGGTAGALCVQREDASSSEPAPGSQVDVEHVPETPESPANGNPAVTAHQPSFWISRLLCLLAPVYLRPSTDWTRPALKEEDNLPDSAY